MQLPLALASFLGALIIGSNTVRGSEAYGSINNFDTVNDTETECHGFEIELEDIHDTDISYTYDYNHYGTPKIFQDDSDPAHPRVFVKYESGKTPGGDWAAYTAIPSAPIAPTQGHQFTDPSVNFGGEHFGVGYSVQPTAIKYHWLVDDGSGNLVLGPVVSLATPSFTYFPPAAGVPGKLQAVIDPPEGDQAIVEFGRASWVKEIRTSSHNNQEVKLRDLVSKDEIYPKARNWANGEPAEVETEWQLLQKDYTTGDGGKNHELKGASERLEKGDDVVTRRYEFYAYVGPLDPEGGEALAENVAKDGIHGTQEYQNTVVVGKYLGSQMSAARAGARVGLVDHLQDGEVGVPYPNRKIVIAGAAPFSAMRIGALPSGMNFDKLTGVLSGTPLTEGAATFKIRATENKHPMIERSYTFTIAASGAAVPPHSIISTTVSPGNGGTSSGGGDIVDGTNATVICTAKPGFVFLNWSEAGVPRSVSSSYTFTVNSNHELLASFTPAGVKVAQTIEFPKLMARKFRHAPLALHAAASSGLSVAFTIVSGPATLAGNQLTMTGVGTIVVRAKQVGNAGFAAAPAVTNSLVVSN